MVRSLDHRGRTITEEAFAVRATVDAGLTLAPMALSQVSVTVPATVECGTVTLEEEEGPLGLCPVRGVTEVKQKTKIWLANSGSRPREVSGGPGRLAGETGVRG